MWLWGRVHRNEDFPECITIGLKVDAGGRIIHACLNIGECSLKIILVFVDDANDLLCEHLWFEPDQTRW